MVLTVEGEAGYYYNSLKINGKEITAATDGTYTFVATQESYKVSATFAEKTFNDAGNWNLINQNKGSVSLPNGGDGGSWLTFNKEYTDIDLTVTAKDDTTIASFGRTDVLFRFDNSTHISFGFNKRSDGTISIQSQNDSGDDNEYTIYTKWYDWGALTDAETKQYQEKGVDLRIIRCNTDVYIYIGDRLLGIADLTKNETYPVKEDTKARVSFRHYGDDGVEVVISYMLSDTELFYINEKKVSLADPFVLDNTKADGYYYMYGTRNSTDGAIQCFRSANLMDWDDMGFAIDKTVSDEIRKVLSDSVWAPEVVYDSKSQSYYMFFSATPEPISTGNEITDKINNALGYNAAYVMMVATSKSPDRDFKLVDFTDADSCGAENVRTLNTQTYSEYYAKYSYFNPVKLREFCVIDKTYKDTSYASGKYLPAIDPHPYEDGTGKYLFWVDQYENDRICAVKMADDWLTPDWDTFTVITRAGYKTVSGTEKVTYDLKGAANDYYINEGPEVIKHDGKYYLTYSTGAYAQETYQVIQAVAEPDANGGPLGTYRKLTEKEGAILLSSSMAGNTKVTGAGHHSFVTAGDKLYMVYHRHDDSVAMGSSRNPAIDEVKWITNSDGLPVMYVNGATSTLQPSLDAFSKYINIADDATISADTDGVSKIECLTDGFLSISNYTESDAVNKVGETTITNKTTFTFNFDSLRDVRGIMVYNSKKRENIFTNISQIEFVCVENGVEVIRTIENVAFKSEYYTDDYVTLGAAAYAEFAYLKVKSVKITVDVPEGQEAVGISEIKILGK